VEEMIQNRLEEWSWKEERSWPDEGDCGRRASAWLNRSFEGALRA